MQEFANAIFSRLEMKLNKCVGWRTNVSYGASSDAFKSSDVFV